ncbi:MAG: hypothetical protein LBG23_02160 [Endomicrobium sp.]|nr:hypothetical protein [Endomicrobium sp.]
MGCPGRWGSSIKTTGRSLIYLPTISVSENTVRLNSDMVGPGGGSMDVYAAYGGSIMDIIQEVETPKFGVGNAIIVAGYHL